MTSTAETGGSLVYPTGEGWIAVPSWTTFFRTLGASIAGSNSPERRLVAAVTVPIRSFAACFAALGAVEARARAASQGDEAAHFARLEGLSPGDGLTVMNAGRKYKAAFLSAAEQNGRRGIWIQHEQDQLRTFLPEQICHRVQIGSTGKDRLPKRPDMQPSGNGDSFAASALGLDDPRSFTHRDEFSALIVGQMKILRAEMTEQRIGHVGTGRARAEGTLKSLLRPRSFLNADECYRTDVVSDLRADTAVETSVVPPLVIFDGARGYLRHRTRWRRSSWIVILDLAGRLLDDGVSALNDDYIQRRIESEDLLTDISLPPGIELTVFAEAIR